MASFNQQALLHIGIVFFFMTGKEREREIMTGKKKEKEREKEAQRQVGSAAIIPKCREKGKE